MEPLVTTKKYEIIFSNSFNLFEDSERFLSLKLDNPANATFEFSFLNDSSKGRSIEWESNAEGNHAEVKVKVFNFKQSLGMASQEPVPVLTLQDKRKVYTSIYGQSIQSCLHVTITIFLDKAK